MIGRKQEISIQLNQILDSVLIAIAFWLSHLFRDKLTSLDLGQHKGVSFFPAFLESIPPLVEFFPIMAIIVPFTPIVLEVHGYYDHPLQKTVWKSIKQMFQSLFWIGLVIGVCVIFFKMRNESRSVLLILGVFAGTLLLIKEGLVRRYLQNKVMEEGMRERVLMAGPPADVDKLLETLSADQVATMRIVDKFDISSRPVEEMVEILHDRSVERVIFAADHVHFNRIEKAIHACETEGVEAWLNADFIQTAIAKPTFDAIGDRLMLVFRSTPDVSWALMLKGVIDKVGAMLIILCSLPIWVIAAIGIRCSSPGPILFRQQRSGRHGQPFQMFKFRTMGNDAEKRRDELAENNKMSGPVFKVDDDPRIFGFGKLLRRTSIDELPQLINVIRGEMSLVGPRPLPVYEVEMIEEAAQRRRLSVKPGLTCLWQVMGRNKITSFEEWVKLDLEYIDNWSLWLDLRILLRTIPVVLFGSGAR